MQLCKQSVSQKASHPLTYALTHSLTHSLINHPPIYPAVHHPQQFLSSFAQALNYTTAISLSDSKVQATTPRYCLVDGTKRSVCSQGLRQSEGSRQTLTRAIIRLDYLSHPQQEDEGKEEERTDGENTEEGKREEE
ncbi:hypothetical protein E2C01_099002 [Portunus trituberculatus]|uniref:Uncharacterized protein n=1 Tax=Portunus trituberculatus TaxID=210409 RepID=A0A5B7K957_PORTR|nr:hypothetical protein [Portunus trituberculatus]